MFENQKDYKRLMLFFLVMAAFVVGKTIFFEAVVKPRSYEKSFENAIQVTNINPEQILITYMKKNNTNYSVEHKKVRTLEQAQNFIKAMKQRGGMYFSLSVEGMKPGRMSKSRIQRLKADIFGNQTCQMTEAEGLTTMSSDGIQIAVRYSPYYAKTLLTIGTPTITTEY